MKNYTSQYSDNYFKNKNNRDKYDAQMKKNRTRFALCCMILIEVIVLIGVILTNQNNKFKTNVEKINDKKTLENMLKSIMDNTSIENGDCLSYALYYKDLLRKTYPELDVRKIDMAGDCPIGTKECGEWEGIPHTYLIVNGHGGECILDQHSLACIQLR